LTLTAGIAAAWFISGALTAILVALMLWSLLGALQCIHALTLASLLNYFNPGMAPASAEDGILARGILVIVAFRLLPMLKSQNAQLLWPLWAFSCVAFVLSIQTSSAVPISVMKLLTLVVVVSSVFIAYDALSQREIAALQSWYGSVAVVLVGSALATLAIPRVAYFRNGTGLQGILNHPQALATVVAPFVAWQLAGLFLVRTDQRPLRVAALAASSVVLYLTEARTGAAAVVIGTLAGVIMRLMSSRRARLLAGGGRALTVALLLIVALAAVQASTGKIFDTARKFAYKRAESHKVSGAFDESRGDGIESQWRNFLAEPVMGHGFGVNAEGPPTTSVVEAFGIPISAPTEKGFVFTAVLEETGIIGGLLFFIMLGNLGRHAARNADPRWMAMFVACVATNVGEAIILAPGGIGLMEWLLTGLAVVSARLPSTALGPAPAASLPPAPAPVRFPHLMRP
jgi:hypothetical protein